MQAMVRLGNIKNNYRVCLSLSFVLMAVLLTGCSFVDTIRPEVNNRQLLITSPEIFESVTGEQTSSVLGDTTLPPETLPGTTYSGSGGSGGSPGSTPTVDYGSGAASIANPEAAGNGLGGSVGTVAQTVGDHLIISPMDFQPRTSECIGITDYISLHAKDILEEIHSICQQYENVYFAATVAGYNWENDEYIPATSTYTRTAAGSNVLCDYETLAEYWGYWLDGQPFMYNSDKVAKSVQPYLDEIAEHNGKDGITNTTLAINVKDGIFSSEFMTLWKSYSNGNTSLETFKKALERIDLSSRISSVIPETEYYYWNNSGRRATISIKLDSEWGVPSQYIQPMFSSFNYHTDRKTDRTVFTKTNNSSMFKVFDDGYNKVIVYITATSKKYLFKNSSGSNVSDIILTSQEQTRLKQLFNALQAPSAYTHSNKSDLISKGIPIVASGVVGVR